MGKITKKKFKLLISEMVGVPSAIELNVIEDNEGDKVKRRGDEVSLNKDNIPKVAKTLADKKILKLKSLLRDTEELLADQSKYEMQEFIRKTIAQSQYYSRNHTRYFDR